MEKIIKTKEKESALPGIIASGVGGAVAGGIFGLIDGIADTEIFSNGVVPLGCSAYVFATVKPSKQLGIFQGAAEVGGVLAGYHLAYPLIKSLVKYLK
jgi:hypothetical protein